MSLIGTDNSQQFSCGTCHLERAPFFFCVPDFRYLPFHGPVSGASITRQNISSRFEESVVTRAVTSLKILRQVAAAYRRRGGPEEEAIDRGEWEFTSSA